MVSLKDIKGTCIVCGRVSELVVCNPCREEAQAEEKQRR